MKRNLWINLGLLAVFAVLLTLALQPTSTESNRPAPISELSREQITTLRVIRANRPDIVLNRQDGHWQITSPTRHRASLDRVGMILNLADWPSSDGFDPDDTDLRQYGLSRPDIVVSLDNRLFAFGDIEPLSQQRYLLFERRVHLVDDNIFKLLSSGVGGLASPQLLADDAEVREFLLPSARLTRQADRWTTQPSGDRLDSDGMTRFIDAWKTTRASWIEFGEIDISEREPLVITLANGDSIEYLLLNKRADTQLYHADSKLNFRLLGDTGIALLTPPTTRSATATPETALE